MATWLEKINDGLKIQTGDGEEFTPFWVNAKKSKEYNVSKFEFVNLPGSLVDRRLPKGNEYTLEIHFQGADHLDTAQKFYTSADDIRHWVLQHPFYGYLLVQPLAIGQDNSDLNLSKFIIPVVETIVEDNPKVTVDPIDAIPIGKIQLDEQVELSITAELQSVDIVNLKAANKKFFDISVPIIKLPEELAMIMDAFNKANAAIDTATSNAQAAMNAAMQVILAPARFAANIKTRMGALKSQFDSLRNVVNTLTGVSGKQVYQAQANALISTMCLASAYPNAGDFSNAKKVAETIKTINDTYTAYLADIDAIQSPNGSSPDSFIPDFSSVALLNELINTTISYLYTVAIGARRERFIICEDDTNIILLTHRLYGLDDLDANIDELMENNELHIDEILFIPKGRKIIYYT